MSPRAVHQSVPGSAVSCEAEKAGIGVMSRDEAEAFSATTEMTPPQSSRTTRAVMPFISTSWSDTWLGDFRLGALPGGRCRRQSGVYVNGRVVRYRTRVNFVEVPRRGST